MAMYKTGNPLGSSAPKDLFDNAQILDHFVNDGEAIKWPNRFDRDELTLHGMRQAFQEFLINSGYQDMGDYAAGLELTARNQIFHKDGELYRASAALVLPYTLTGNWAQEKDLFVAMGDAALRQQLALPGGGKMVGMEYGTASDAVYYVTPEMFGAKGDGVSNDTAALQSAIDTGRPVHASSGSLYLVDGLSLNGDPNMLGLRLVLSDVSHVDCLSILNAKSGFVYDCSFHVNKSAHLSHDVCAFRIENSKKVSIHSSRFSGGTNVTYIGHASSSTLFVEDSEFVKISDCYVDDGERENLAIINSKYCTVHNTTATGAGYSNITTVLGSHHTISNSTSLNSGTSGISVNSKSSIVNGCIADGTRDQFSNGINMGHPGVYAADNSTVLGCMVLNAVHAGIGATGSDDVSISGNTIISSGATLYGILYANNPGAALVSNNSLIGEFTEPIRYYNNSSNRMPVVITNNKTGAFKNAAISIRGASSLKIADNHLVIDGMSADNEFSAFVDISLSDSGSITDNFMRSSGTTQPRYGVRAPGSADIKRIEVRDNFYRGSGKFENITQAQGVLVDLRDNNISDDQMFGGVTLAEGSTQTEITNRNIIERHTMPFVIAGSSAAQNVRVDIRAIRNGSFTLHHSAAPANAFFRYRI